VTSFFGDMKGRNFAEEEELLSMRSERMSEIAPDMILRVIPAWDRRLSLLMEQEYPE
jgi:hypothetical protein